MAAACDSNFKCVSAAVVHSELNSHQLILIRLSYFLKICLVCSQQYVYLAVCMQFSSSNGESPCQASWPRPRSESPYRDGEGDGARQLTNFNLDLHVAVHSQAIGLSEVPASTCHEALRFHLEGSPMTGKPKSNPSKLTSHHLFIPP